jgi:hypothetical protein
MKTAKSIKPYKHPWLKFVVRSKLSGKWERKFFRTKAEAQTYVRLKEVELLNQGREGATFPSSLRVMAQQGRKSCGHLAKQSLMLSIFT